MDSGASMHMLSRKDSNSAELGTVRVSRNATTGHHSRVKSANERGWDQRFGFVLDGAAPRRYSDNLFFVVISAKIMVCHGVVRRSNTKSYPKWLETTLYFLVFRAKLQAPVRHERQINFSSQGLREATRREIQCEGNRHMNGYHEVAPSETCENGCHFGCFTGKLVRRSFSFRMRSTCSFGTMSSLSSTAQVAHESTLCSHISSRTRISKCADGTRKYEGSEQKTH